MKIRLLKTYNFLITGLLAMLGFATACDSKDEYGVPSAKFIVKGKVKSAKTDKPIENIRVSMQGDTAFTNVDGFYQVIDEFGFPGDQIYNVEFEDIDGELNGEFNDSNSTVEFVDPKFKGGTGDWYSGETSKEFDIKLTPKNNGK